MRSSNLALPGILMPHLKYHFRVSFLNDDDTELDISQALAEGVISVTPIEQSKSLDDRIFFIMFEDDASNRVGKAVQQLAGLESFTTKIEHLDGNAKVVKTLRVEHSLVSSIVHDECDYATPGQREALDISVKVPELFGNAITELVKDPKVELLYNLLSNLEMKVSLPLSQKKPLVTNTRIMVQYMPADVKVE
jgi:hypothetical protein